MKTPSFAAPKPPKLSASANSKHDGSPKRPRTSTVPKQSTLQRKTDDVFPEVCKHQPAGSSLDATSAQPYRQVTRSWASRNLTQLGINGSSSQDMTPMDRWVYQGTRDEMWNNIQGVYGTYGQHGGVGAAEDGTVQSGEAVDDSETRKPM